MPRLVDQVYTVTQSAFFAAWIASTGVSAVYSNLTINLSQFSDNLTAFTSLFDQYKINVVEAWLRPVGGSLGNNLGATSDLFTVLDYDSPGPLTSIANANGYSTCIQSEPGETQRRCFRPRVAYAAYGSGAFTSYANQQAGWIDCASTNVAHYGMLGAVTQGSASPALASWDLDVRASISFRSTH